MKYPTGWGSKRETFPKFALGIGEGAIVKNREDHKTLNSVFHRCYRSLTRLKTFVGSSPVYYVMSPLTRFILMSRYDVLFTAVTPLKANLRIIKSLKQDIKNNN